jgi:hypothetical protein
MASIFLLKETIMAMDNTAAKAAKLREMAKDKSLPQDVRNTYLDEAVKLEEKAAVKAGVKLAKGGAVAKALPKRGQRTATNMAKGGSVAKKAKGK